MGGYPKYESSQPVSSFQCPHCSKASVLEVHSTYEPVVRDNRGVHENRTFPNGVQAYGSWETRSLECTSCSWEKVTSWHINPKQQEDTDPVTQYLGSYFKLHDGGIVDQLERDDWLSLARQNAAFEREEKVRAAETHRLELIEGLKSLLEGNTDGEKSDKIKQILYALTELGQLGIGDTTIRYQDFREEFKHYLTGKVKGDRDRGVSDQVIYCDSDPYISHVESWKIKEHRNKDIIDLGVSRIDVLPPRGFDTVPKNRLARLFYQPDAPIGIETLRRKIRHRQDVANACVLDHLLAYPHLIPNDWGARPVYFLGTVYRDAIYSQFVRYLQGTNQGKIALRPLHSLSKNDLVAVVAHSSL